MSVLVGINWLFSIQRVTMTLSYRLQARINRSKRIVLVKLSPTFVKCIKSKSCQFFFLSTLHSSVECWMNVCDRTFLAIVKILSWLYTISSHLFYFFSYSLCGRDVNVNVTTTIQCHLGKKPRTINVEGVATADQIGFKHTGNTIVYEVPPALCSPA